MKERQEEITAIIDRIDDTQPNLKAQVVREVDEKMRKLEQDLIARDKEMKKMNARVQRAMTETVDLTTLSHKVFGKYIKFVNTQVEERQNSHPLIAKSRKLKQLEQDIGQKQTLDDVQKGLRDQSPTPLLNKASSAPNPEDPEFTTTTQNLMQTGNSIRQGLTQASTTEQYRLAKTNNSVFFMRSDSADIFFMDVHRTGRFCKETLKGVTLPYKFGSIQTSDGSIYVVGGYQL